MSKEKALRDLRTQIADGERFTSLNTSNAAIAGELNHEFTEILAGFGLGKSFVRAVTELGMSIVGVSVSRDGVEITVSGNEAGFGSFMACEPGEAVRPDDVMDFLDEACHGLGLRKPVQQRSFGLPTCVP